jgi:hypothetical protein
VKVPEPDEERPLAWKAILADTPVFSSDGEEIGGVHEVLGAEDIFHGIVVRSGPVGEDIMVPAERVTSITNRRIDLRLSAVDIRALPPFREAETFSLGFVGLLRRRLGWKEDDNEQP